MSSRPLKLAAAALVTTALTVLPFGSAADAGGFSRGVPGKTNCAPACSSGCGGGVVINKPVTINKNVNVYKPVVINKDVNIYKPVIIDKSVNIYKPVTIDKSINITKNIDASKNININKTIIIDKGGSGGAEASAWASAWAQASANASASVGNIVIYSGYNEYITVNNKIGGGGEIGAAAISTARGGACEMQDATVIKAVHAVCVAPDGREFPASHMTSDTWIDSGFEGEVLRCIPGSHLKVTLGDVSQSDQGMAGTFANGASLECAPNEALRHFKDGMLKCVPKLPVKDCTERTNLRRWGTGDVFFTFRTKVCAPGKTTTAARELELSGMSLTGGVGE
jgi:hypothetical protein